MSAKFAAAIKDVAKKKGVVKKKETMPVIDDAPNNVIDAVDAFNVAKAEFKAAKAEMDVSGEVIIDFVRKKQDDDGYNSDFKNSYKVVGNETTVSVVFSNRFSINAEDEDTISGLVGDGFDKLFDKKYNVKLKEEVMTSEKLQKELMAMVGKNFGKFFEVEESIVVKDNFKEKVYGFVNPGNLDDLRMLVKQAKPSLK